MSAGADDTTDAVAEAREMIAEFERGRTRYEGQPERADERYNRNRRALVVRIKDLEAKLAECESSFTDRDQKLAAVTLERDEYKNAFEKADRLESENASLRNAISAVRVAMRVHVTEECGECCVHGDLDAALQIAPM